MVDWYKYLREVCSTELLANPVVIGGPGHVVAIDESVVARRKPGNAQGRPVPAMWVFGGVDTTTKDFFKFFMQIVPRRDAQTLLPIITRHIAAGSTIWSDEWAAYNGLAGLNGYAHSTVNHSQRFVDPRDWGSHERYRKPLERLQGSAQEAARRGSPRCARLPG